MGDPPFNSGSTGNSEIASRKNVYKKNLGGATADSKALAQNAYKHLAFQSHSRNVSGAVGHMAIFLLKVAALETVRRVSRSKFPPLWRGVQALQFLCYPPFKWVQKWAPFKGLVKGVQMFSRPLLFLSVASAISEQTECDTSGSNNTNGSPARSDSEINSESTNPHTSLDTRTGDENLEIVASENWLIQVHKELENQGITLPERINEDELNRFFTAANGDLSCLLLTIKKTIRWRETYGILSEQELERWSSLVFWHGFDVENRPCLIVRLGLACINLPSNERPRFAQAVISQVEHGVLNLVDRDNPQITVLVDCHGISPLRVPMQMVRSCSSVLQDNFPNRLGHLLVIRLPPVVRVVAQTFIQVLKPATRKKLRIEGSRYHQVICEYLQTLPAYLGGICECKICLKTSTRVRRVNEIRRIESAEDLNDGEDLLSPSQADYPLNETWDHLVRTAVIGVLMVWIFIAVLAVLYDPEIRPF
ncbi:SEC14 cytosolic factor family protein / phosphoglyceride transfer family protein [Euphorbia peplus]|nr:SEC14 cytosolic factor family protein / phosphoglyceride transfer family protein [Euphorbia peplus]